MRLERRRIIYTGHVQGVGFRWRTASILRSFQITGYVMNLPDGSVELVIEGSPADNDAATSRVSAQLGRHIHGEALEVGPATGEFQTFGIRR
jgi:acylphosphatase